MSTPLEIIAHSEGLPALDRREHEELERIAGRTLSNDEAQTLRREAVLVAAFMDWLEAIRERKAN